MPRLLGGILLLDYQLLLAYSFVPEHLQVLHLAFKQWILLILVGFLLPEMGFLLLPTLGNEGWFLG